MLERANADDAITRGVIANAESLMTDVVTSDLALARGAAPSLYHEERETRRLLSGIQLHQHAIAKHKESHICIVFGPQNILRIFWLHKLPATMGPNLASPSNGAQCSDGLTLNVLDSTSYCIKVNLPEVLNTTQEPTRKHDRLPCTRSQNHSSTKTSVPPASCRVGRREQ